MDPSDFSLVDGFEAVVNVDSNVDSVVTETDESVVVTNGDFENFDDDLCKEELKEGLNGRIEGNNVGILKDEDVEIGDETEKLKSRTSNGPVKDKKVKHLSGKGVNAGLVRKSKVGKDEEVAAAAAAVSNGTSSLDSNPRQAVKSRALNDKQTRLNKQAGKSDAATSEAPMEKTRPQLIKKEPLDNLQGNADLSSPTAEDGKPRRMGTMPTYGFSFKCNERAERRKEFYSKLEERIHAKEVEESNMQAKTKESQEAEIRRLRKKLAFKATPMPSFYQEPPPSRVELKKIPTTRAKSPKLGRKKTSTSSEVEGNTISSALQCRLSLDEKLSQNTPTKGISPVQPKKPQRKSLPPRLSPERISSSNTTTARPPSKAVNDVKASLSSVTTDVTTLSIATKEEKVEAAAAIEENNALSDETSETPSLNIDSGEVESHANGDIVEEDKPQLTLVQEPIAAEY
ncbi:protein WVD2-like 6 [Vicia villosa]|uniref:protein WVD2-like 6 n=1 Tax=Vicia villosa TaxID=3911 RepID=UPI00273B48BC|nr:protein WVD2-like 6 [Vicia villosa]XP_058785893.1 protein WVD2-like 6 [Vicia villosa]